MEAGLLHDLTVQTDRVNVLQVQLEHTLAESLVTNQERKKGVDTLNLVLTLPFSLTFALKPYFQRRGSMMSSLCVWFTMHSKL
jgi:hypothetical protein